SVDAAGNRELTLGHVGYAVNTHNGARLDVTATPTPQTVTNLRMFDKRFAFDGDIAKGSTVSYTGPKITLPNGATGVDQFTISGSGRLTAGDGGANRGGFTFAGAASFRSAEGDTLAPAPGQPGTMATGMGAVVGRDGQGLGGVIALGDFSDR